MSIILHLETSGPICSAAIGIDGQLVSSYEASETNDHAGQITIAISKLLEKCNLDLQSLSCVAISSGPGSYTGLRVSTSAAKGICYALKIPLIAVNTLLSIADASKTENLPNAHFVPMIDARRMEVYTAMFDAGLKPIFSPHARIMDKSKSKELVQDINTPIIISGSGLDKCKHLFSSENVLFRDDIKISAKNLVGPAFKKFQEQDFENLAYFKPYYLKPPNITTPKPILR